MELLGYVMLYKWCRHWSQTHPDFSPESLPPRDLRQVTVLISCRVYHCAWQTDNGLSPLSFLLLLQKTFNAKQALESDYWARIHFKASKLTYYLLKPIFLKQFNNVVSIICHGKSLSLGFLFHQIQNNDLQQSLYATGPVTALEIGAMSPSR
jgi:hypothetical protein